MSGAFFVVCHRLHASKNLIYTIYMLLSDMQVTTCI